MYGLMGWLVLGRKPVSGKMPRIEAKVVYDCSINASAASGIKAVQLRRIECLAMGGITCQIAPTLDPPPTKAGSATQGLARPAGSGSRGGANLSGPQTTSQVVVLVKRGKLSPSSSPTFLASHPRDPPSAARRP